MPTSLKFYMILVLCCLASSTIIGIDFGRTYFKASLLSKDKPLHFAINSNSKRLTPNYFAFWNRTKSTNYSSANNWSDDNANDFEFAYGERAHEQCLRFPKTCLKGLPLDNRTYFSMRGYEITALALQSYIKSITDAEKINDTLEAVVALPPGMDPHEKSFLYAALSISNITTLQFVDALTAPAQLYALEKYKGEPNKTVAFVDIGGSGTRVSIFVFDNSTGIVNITQVAAQFDEEMGGEVLDQLLAVNIAKKYKVNLENLKTKVNFVSDISIVKEMLTMHPAVDLKFEEDDDFEEEKLIKITRQDLADVGENMNKTIYNLVKQAMNQARLSNNNISSVELIGGCTHIPFIQEAIKNVFNISKLGHKLNADSAVAIGAGYLGAEQSQYFIVRPTTKSFMLTSSSILRTVSDLHPIIFKLYAQGDSEDGSKIVQARVDPKQEFIISTGNSKLDYMKFSIKNLSKPIDAEISFIHNYFLMPVPINITSNEGQESFDFELKNIGWEVSDNELIHSGEKVSRLLMLQQQRRSIEKLINDYETELIRLKKFIEGNSNSISDSERSIIEKAVNEGFEWFESQNTNLDIKEYQSKLDNLHLVAGDIVDKIIEENKKPIIKSKILKTVAKAKEILNFSLMVGKFDASLQDDLMSEIKSVEEWINELSQNNFENINSKEIEVRRTQLKKKVIKFKNELKKIQKELNTTYKNEL